LCGRRGERQDPKRREESEGGRRWGSWLGCGRGELEALVLSGHGGAGDGADLVVGEWIHWV
jgi:hypothetical protein